MAWLAEVPRIVNQLRDARPVRIQADAQALGRREIKLQTIARAYVDPDRIEQLQRISNQKFDLTKLVRLCEEINVCFAGECYFAIAMIVRSMLDHVPPIFDCGKFSELANNYGGTKSFKESMKNLAVCGKTRVERVTPEMLGSSILHARRRSAASRHVQLSFA
jgi:hypothetical protein